MPLKKLTFKAGINRENTRYTSENGWYECDNIRFRQGTPEKIGGWTRISTNTFLGVCRSLWNWVTLTFANYMGVGTNLKFYIENGGAYYDITPIRATVVYTGAFTATNGSATISVAATAHGGVTGDFVTFSGATGLGGNITAAVLNREYQITVTGDNTFTFVATAVANASDIGTGGTVTAAYQINVGPEVAIPLSGWGAGPWGSGTWGIGLGSSVALRIWSQNNFGEKLLFGPQGGPLYYWDPASTLNSRGVLVSSLSGASDVPVVQNIILVSDASRFVLVFGTNEIGSSVLNPMLIRWSDQESAVNWTQSPTNQAGSLQLSHGSQIVSVVQSRQEILVFTDSSLYSLQYLGPPIVWGSQLLADNVSIASVNAVSVASNVTYWMGVDKFYKYDGRVQTLKCDLRQFVYGDINLAQKMQFFSSTNEGFNEVWWFYCTANSTVIDRYVVYNYLEDVWYYGSMGRTAWIDTGLRDNPQAATYVKNLVNHESGVDDNATGTTAAINAFITSAEFDLDDGYNFMFVWRMLPDVTFRGSTAANPQLTMSLLPMKNSGSGYNIPASEGGTNIVDVVQTSRDGVYQIEQFTGQVYTRVRGRQMAIKAACNQLGATFQLGSPRIDVRQDGRR